LTRRAFVLVCLLAAAGPAVGACLPDRVQDSGSIYRICRPEAGRDNGALVVWAHGFQDAGTPVSIPEDQLQALGVPLPALVNALGFSFATNSYSKTGLAVRQGMADVLDLVKIYAKRFGEPRKVYLLGASEGGLITALLVEQNPGVFDAGVAACGPVGDFEYQMRYFGDARATFDYFFPGLLPGDPFDPPPALVLNWPGYYDAVVRPALLDPGNRDALDQWVRVASLPYDPQDYLGTVEHSARDVLRYAVVNIGDAVRTLGGFPYDNRGTVYRGSRDDLALNLAVPRLSADPAAVAEMRAHYDTTGRLRVPLVTMHTRLDQQIPYAHEPMYAAKTAASGAFGTRHFNIPVERYGHCGFTVGEALTAFGLMLYLDRRATGPRAAAR